MYELGLAVQGSNVEISNIQRNFLWGQKIDGKSSSGEEAFWFYIDGGVDKVNLEWNYTQTVFYLA